MKKGSLNFLGRKTQSLFDTNVEFKDMDKVELVLESAAIPESGTAKVRSRPTVKHFTSSESVQGFAVPTPKVPVLPPFNEPKINGTGSTTNLPNGRMLSVPDLLEGEILVPPPPSSAPPPPPSFSAPPPPSFVPPSPHFFGEMDPSLDRPSLHPPSMAPPKTPSLVGSDYSADLDLASLKPPPMPPPKPPSESPSLRGSLSSLVQDIPECPKFTPPPPPVKASPVLAKAQKTAPPKPVRMSSISNLDIQSQTPVPPVASNPTPSSFNPQNSAKLYNVQKSTLFVGETEREKKVQSILMLEDTAGNTVGVVSGNSGKNTGSLEPGVPPTKPARRNSSATHLQEDQPDKAPVLNEPVKVEPKISPEPVLAQNIPTEVPAPIRISPKIEKRIPNVRQVVTPVASPGRPRKYSPILNHRHLNTRGADGSVKKETSTSPLALLMAAKEREKQRTALSRQNSNSSELVSSVIQPSEEKPNSFTVIPRNPTPDSPNAQLKSTSNTQPITSPSPRFNVPEVSYSKPELNSTQSPMNSSVSGLGVPVKDVEIGEDLVFIPPPPEFANSDPEEEPPVPPPSHPAPVPPVKSAPPPTKAFLPVTPAPITSCPLPSHPAPATIKLAPPPTKPLPPPITNVPPPSHPAPPPAKPSLPPTPPPVTNGPLTSLKPKPPSSPPKAPGPPPNIQPQFKPPVQTKPTQPPAQVAPSVSASQATLLSILQKKMLEMDPKFSAVKEAETNGDDWNSPLSDDEATSLPATYNPMTNRSFSLPTQTRGVDMKELETKVAKKAQNLATSAKSQNSNGPSAKQQFGMTFTIRPGTKQPITPVIKDGSS